MEGATGVGVSVVVVVVVVTGATVGSNVGSSNGSSVGSNVGSRLGSKLGSTVGSAEGSRLGSTVGSRLGSKDGSIVGSRLGCKVGTKTVVVVVLNTKQLHHVSIQYVKHKFIDVPPQTQAIGRVGRNTHTCKRFKNLNTKTPCGNLSLWQPSGQKLWIFLDSTLCFSPNVRKFSHGFSMRKIPSV